MRRTTKGTWAIVLLAITLVLGACASSGDEKSAAGDDGSSGRSVIEAGWLNETDLEPTTGSTIEVTLGTAPRGLDPNSATLGLLTEGPVLTAVFDSLMRYDPATGKFVGQLAEGITSNGDFTEWTIKLRPGVRFSDGTPLNADAVVYSLKRLGGAKSAAASYVAYFTSIEATDELTVVLGLDEPLNNVDALFTAEPGFIVSPTAAEAAGASFATKPVGAGPFMVERFDPASELILVKNPGYSLGEVRADRIRMTWGSAQGANLEKVSTGQSDMAFLTNPVSVAQAIEEGLPTYTTLVGGAGFTINSAAGRDFPGNDPRVRQAISRAIDPDVVNERATDGQGVSGRFLLPPGNRFHVDTPYSLSGVDEARALLDEVKKDTGWDGSFTITTEESNEDVALSAQAQLNAVGFTVEVERLADFSQIIERTLVNRDFDMSTWVMTTYDTNIYQALSRSLLSSSRSNYMGFASPEMDAILGELRAAPDEDSTRTVLNKMAALWQTEQPFFFRGASPFSTVTSPKIGGIVPTAIGVFLWSDVFKA